MKGVLTLHRSGMLSRFAVIVLMLFFASLACRVADAGEQQIYRTGLEAKKGYLAVSPDGARLVLKTDHLAHGLRLLNLRNGKMATIPCEVGRTFGLPGWSSDGRQVAVVSTAVRDNRPVVDDSRITLLDTTTWQYRNISLSEGVKTFPFFSANGKTVYYFNGKKREGGKTPANRYDLFAIDLASGQETKLTDEEFYQAGKGDDNGKTVLFQAIGGKRYKGIKDASKSTLYLYDKQNGNVAPISIKNNSGVFDFSSPQNSGIFEFSSPQRDKLGNLFFIAAKARPGGGNFLWFLFATIGNGGNPVALTELPIALKFDIAKNTGEIYVMDKTGEELIIRKLATTAAH